MNLFDEAYRGTPPWDIGRPQPGVVRLEEAGEIRGDVLDVGCGTGENTLYLASRGHACVGVDFAARAVERARQKATERGSNARFRTGDALAPEGLSGTFDTILDCGLFHTFLDKHRPVYAANVKAALRRGGRYFVFCFSEFEPAGWGGPRRIRQDELRTTFGPFLRERWIHEARFETNFPNVEGRAWLGSFERPERTSRRAPRARSAGPKSPARQAQTLPRARTPA